MILQTCQIPGARDLQLIQVVQAVTNHLVRDDTLCEYIRYDIVEIRDAEYDLLGEEVGILRSMI